MNVWKQYVEHDFVRQLGNGTLSQECFIHFLKCAAVVVPFGPTTF
jgi:thiaminase